MGYTHYWRKEKEIDEKIYTLIVNDFGKCLSTLRQYIDLADSNGEGMPWISAATGQVRFNGREKCGHQQNSKIVIPWPENDAGGVAGYGENNESGQWFSGASIKTRMCNGDCSYESFVFDRVYPGREGEEPDKEGRFFDFCKTAFRPYDLAVITFLIIAKHRLGDKIQVASDGQDCHWFDGKLICQSVLGYGLDYQINKENGQLVQGAGKENIR